MIRGSLILATALLGAMPLAAQTLTLDPHLDLPKSASAPDWNGLHDPTSQFDLDRAKAGGLDAAAIALFVPQRPRDAAIHAVVDRNPQRAALKANGGVIAINAFGAYLRPRAPATLKAVAALQASFGLSASGGVTLTPDRQAEYDRRYHDIVGKEPKAGVADLIDAVDYAVKRIGIDHVALSSDFNHGGGVVGWNDVGELGNVTAELKRRRYTPAQIGKLWSGNVLRVWQAAIDARKGAA